MHVMSSKGIYTAVQEACEELRESHLKDLQADRVHRANYRDRRRNDSAYLDLRR